MDAALAKLEATFSAGGLGSDIAATFPSLDATANAKLRLLWIACGTEDALITANRQLRTWLTSKGVRHTDVETPGMHQAVWTGETAHGRAAAGLYFVRYQSPAGVFNRRLVIAR